MFSAARALTLLVLTTAATPAQAPASFDELSTRANAARAADRLPEAINLYQQALQLKPDWTEGWWYLGTLFYDADRYADGRQAFAQFVQRTGTPPGLAFLGLCEFETGDYPQSLDHLQKALAAGLPSDIEPVARFHQALLLTRLGDFQEAWRHYRPLVAQGSHDPTLIAALGLNALNKALLPKEIPADQHELIAAAGQTANTWLAGDTTKTEAAFHSLLSAYPNAPGVHNLYATYLLSAHPDEALPEFRRELELNPHDSEARAMLSVLLFKGGNHAEALPLAQKAAEERPASPLTQYAYGLALPDPRQSIEHLEIAARLDPSNLEVHLALAGAYSKAGRHDDARRERKLSIQLAKETDPRH